MKKPNQKHPSDSLKEIREELGFSMEEMARTLGYAGASSYQYYEDKDAYKKDYFETTFISRLLENLVSKGIKEERIKKLMIPMQSSVEFLNKNLYSSGEFTYIRRESGVEVSAGHGVSNPIESQEYEMVAFRTDWLRDITSTHPDNLRVIPVRGESMEPTLKGGDNVLVDLTRNVPNDDGMYVIRYDGNLLVKRITIDPIRNEITISSDNKNYAPLKVYDANVVKVAGRVIWLGRKV